MGPQFVSHGLPTIDTVDEYSGIWSPSTIIISTLNITHGIASEQRLSAEAFLNGAFYFNQTPLDLPRTKVHMFEGARYQLTFDQHGVGVWCLGPAPEHYICYT